MGATWKSTMFDGRHGDGSTCQAAVGCPEEAMYRFTYHCGPVVQQVLCVEHGGHTLKYLDEQAGQPVPTCPTHGSPMARPTWEQL